MRQLTKDALYRPDEVAEILGVHVKTIRRWVQEGKIIGIKYTRKCLRITGKSILEFSVGNDLDVR